MIIVVRVMMVVVMVLMSARHWDAGVVAVGSSGGVNFGFHSQTTLMMVKMMIVMMILASRLKW